jgi:hypothetical protein
MLANGPQGDGAISAEWEIAVYDCLRDVGELNFSTEKGRNVDVLLFTSSITHEQVFAFKLF